MDKIFVALVGEIIVLLDLGDEIVLNNLKMISLFLIAVAVSTGKGGFLGIAAGLAVIVCCLDKNRFSNIKDCSFLLTVKVFLFFTGTLLVLSVFQDNPDGIKDVGRYFERTASFFIIYIFLGKVRNFLPITIIGLVIGFFANDIFVIESCRNYGTRAVGLFGSANKFGGSIAFVLPFFIYFTWLYRNRTKYFCILFASTALLFGCLVVSGSRGAWIACVVECLLLLSIFLHRSRNLRITKKRVAYLFVTIAVVIFLLVGIFSRSYDGERILLWRAAWQMFLDHPIAGIGLLHFNEVYTAYYLSPLAKEPGLPHPHNLFLNFLSETGIIGLSAYLSMIFVQMKLCIEFNNRNKDINGQYITLPIVYLVAVVGMLEHGMVDVISITRDYMLLSFFLWGIVCLHFNEYNTLGCQGKKICKYNIFDGKQKEIRL